MKTTRPSPRAKRTDSVRESNGAPELNAAPLDILPATSSDKAAPLAPEKKKVKKIERKQRKERLGAMKEMASSFPMIALIEARVKDSIPKEIVQRIESAKSNKHIIGLNYPYEK